MSPAKIAYYVIAVQLSAVTFVAALYWAGHEHGWAKTGDLLLAAAMWLTLFGALGTLRRDQP